MVLIHILEEWQEYGGSYYAAYFCYRLISFYFYKINRLYNTAFNDRMFVRKFDWLVQ